MFRRTVAALVAAYLATSPCFATTINDDFESADSLAGWVVEQGAISETGGEMVVNTGGFVDNIAIHQTSVGSADQYVKFQFGTSDRQYPIIVLRFTNDASEFYLLYVDGNNGQIDWYHFDSVGGTGTQLGTGTFGAAIDGGGEAIGVTIEGTGTSTVLRFWRTLTADAPDSASSWDSGAPDFSITTDPSNAVDTGNLVGLGATQGSADYNQYSEFWAGDLGGGGGGPTIPLTLQNLGKGYGPQRSQQLGGLLQ